MNVVVMACHLIFASEAVPTAEFAPWYRAREFLWLLAVSDFVVADQVGPVFAGEGTVLLDAKKEWSSGLMEMVAFMCDVVAIGVC